MKLKIYNHSNKIMMEKNEIKYCFDFMLSHLVSEDLKSELQIDCRFKQNLFETALTDIIDDEETDPRIFEVILNSSLNRDELISAIAHECVHVKQFSLNELKDLDVDKSAIYCNKKYDTSKLEYWDFPWEIEAYGREYGLTQRYHSSLLQLIDFSE